MDDQPADYSGDKQKVEKFDVVDQRSPFRTRGIVRKPSRREVNRSTRMAFLTGFEKVFFYNSRLGVMDRSDIVDPVAISADGRQMRRGILLLSIEGNSHSMEILKICRNHVGGDIIISHKLLVGVTVGAQRGNIHTKPHLSGIFRRVSLVAGCAGGNIWISVFQERPTMDA